MNISRTVWLTDLRQFFMHVTCGHSSVLPWWHCDMLCTLVLWATSRLPMMEQGMQVGHKHKLVRQVTAWIWHRGISQTVSPGDSTIPGLSLMSVWLPCLVLYVNFVHMCVPCSEQLVVIIMFVLMQWLLHCNWNLTKYMRHYLFLHFHSHVVQHMSTEQFDIVCCINVHS